MSLLRSEAASTLLQDDGSLVRRTVLGNGLRIVSEQLPSTRSVMFGVWIGAGSRDEEADQHGAAHYLEHLLFKATKRRTAFEVNAALDAVGGELNAFTSRESTCFYAHVRAADLPVAVDVVLDVVTAGLMREEDVEAERQVVLEEIAMHEDDPADVAMERFTSAVLPDPALARSILGTPHGIEQLRAQRIRAFHAAHYLPRSMVVTAVGGVDHQQVVDLVAEALAGWAPAGGPPRGGVGAPEAEQRTEVAVVRRPAEQAHLVVGGLGIPRNDPDKYALAVFNTILGGGLSSRLFQAVREERGLAYSVYSFAAPFRETGLFGVYCGTRPQNADEALAVIRAELRRAADGGFTEEELARGRGAVRGSRVLALEELPARMNRLAHAEFGGTELLRIDEMEARIAAVSADDLERVAHRVLAGPRTAVAIGPMPEGWRPVPC